MVLSGAGAAEGDWAPEEPSDRGQGRTTHTHTHTHTLHIHPLEAVGTSPHPTSPAECRNAVRPDTAMQCGLVVSGRRSSAS